MFADNVLARAGTLAKHRTHLYSPAPLRELLATHLPATFSELVVEFQCVAASIEKAGAHWFTQGNLADAVMASAAVPGLLPPAEVDGEHFLDGGLVHSIPVGRALALGATEIYVLHVGRIEQPLTPPRSLWDVCLTSFELARRHRFVEEMADLPADVRVHVLPSGEEKLPLIAMRYRHSKAVSSRIQRGYRLLETPHAIKRVRILQLGRKIIRVFLQSEPVFSLSVSEILALAKCLGSCQMPWSRLS